MAAIVEKLGLSRLKWSKDDVVDDAGAAVVLGVESVPDGLAGGILAGVNPVSGLYAYMYGVASASLFTSTAFMSVQGTGAMAIIVSDVDLDAADDPTRALVTLSILTGIAMMLAGFFKLGALLKFVSNSVMVGFISAVGLNIVLGQIGDFTGYDAAGDGRVAQTIDTILHPWRLDIWTLLVGLATIALIIGLRKTRLGAMGMVVAIVIGSGLGAIVNALDKNIEVVGDVAEVPNRLPAPMLPLLSEVPGLTVAAISLAFVGLVQGAGVSAAFAREGEGDTDQDFIGQGVGNLGSGIFQGVPVGGSMSATSLVVSAGAKSRWALVYTAVVMGVVILLFAGVVEYIAMPALAGLLIVVGFETIDIDNIMGVYRTGKVQTATMVVTFALTLVIPLQFAVLVGVGMSMLLYVVRQANQIETRRLVLNEDGELEEVDPPEEVPANDVVLLQPYGSLFFAATQLFEEQLPEVTEESRNSVVLLRLRGKPDIGATFIEVLEDYVDQLAAVDSKLMIVTDSDRILEQLRKTKAAEQIGDENLYKSDRRVLATVRQAATDARNWVIERLEADDLPVDDTPVADIDPDVIHARAVPVAERAPDEDAADDESGEADTDDTDDTDEPADDDERTEDES